MIDMIKVIKLHNIDTLKLWYKYFHYGQTSRAPAKVDTLGPISVIYSYHVKTLT